MRTSSIQDVPIDNFRYTILRLRIFLLRIFRCIVFWSRIFQNRIVRWRSSTSSNIIRLSIQSVAYQSWRTFNYMHAYARRIRIWCTYVYIHTKEMRHKQDAPETRPVAVIMLRICCYVSCYIRLQTQSVLCPFVTKTSAEYCKTAMWPQCSLRYACQDKKCHKYPIWNKPPSGVR